MRLPPGSRVTAAVVALILLPHVLLAAWDLGAGPWRVRLPPAAERDRVHRALEPLGPAWDAILRHVPERGTVVLARPEAFAPQVALLGQLVRPRALVDVHLLQDWARRGGTPPDPPEFVLDLAPHEPAPWRDDYRVLETGSGHALWQRRPPGR